MKTKNSIIRCGDKVRVITPEFFVRCGYPKTVESETEVVLRDHGEKIEGFLKQFGLQKSWGSLDPNGVYFERIYNKVAREVAYGRLKQFGFGGKSRMIYTRTEPSLKGKVFEVVGKRRVKTGTYHPPHYSGGGWWGEEDYEPGSLINEKTHVILFLQTCDFIPTMDFPPEIEAIHVERVENVNLQGQ